MKTIPLGDSGQVALVDAADYEAVSQFNWLLHTKGYAFRNLPRDGGNTTTQLMHVFLLGKQAGFDTDHRDGNKLNNQRANLRQATRSQNNANRVKNSGTSSRHKGVCWDTERSKWLAQIKSNGRNHFLGRSNNEEDAAQAYDRAAWRLFGKFARFNFPRPWLNRGLYDRR